MTNEYHLESYNTFQKTLYYQVIIGLDGIDFFEIL